MKKIFSLILLMLFLTSFIACKRKETFKVGVECGYAPYFWTQASSNVDKEKSIKSTNGQYCTGLDAFVIKHIEKELDVKFVYHMYEFDGLITGLVTKQLDLVIAGMSPTKERREVVNFSNNYYQSPQVILVKANSSLANFSKLSEFSGKKIIAQSGTLQEDLIQQIPGAVKMTPLTELSSVIQSIASNVAEAMVVEYAVAKLIVSSRSDLKIIELDQTDTFDVDINDESTAIAVRKDLTELLEKINEVIDNISLQQRQEWLDDAAKRAENAF